MQDGPYLIPEMEIAPPLIAYAPSQNSSKVRSMRRPVLAGVGWNVMPARERLGTGKTCVEVDTAGPRFVY